MYILTCPSSDYPDQPTHPPILMGVFMKKLSLTGYPQRGNNDPNQSAARMRSLIWVFAWFAFPKIHFLILRFRYYTWKMSKWQNRDQDSNKDSQLLYWQFEMLAFLITLRMNTEISLLQREKKTIIRHSSITVGHWPIAYIFLGQIRNYWGVSCLVS